MDAYTYIRDWHNRSNWRLFTMEKLFFWEFFPWKENVFFHGKSFFSNFLLKNEKNYWQFDVFEFSLKNIASTYCDYSYFIHQYPMYSYMRVNDILWRILTDRQNVINSESSTGKLNLFLCWIWLTFNLSFNQYLT